MMKAWEWLKTHWRWLIAPLWIISLILVWLFFGGRKPLLPSGTTDKAADDAMKAKDEAISQFRARLDAMAKKAEERLQDASKDQVDEFNKLKDKPLEEVAKWIDSL
jgi:hypothetical protein